MELTEESTLPDGIKRNDIGKHIEEAEQEFPSEESGTDRSYHTVTQGYIQNEIFRRLDPEGRTMGEALREEIEEPLGAEVHFGLNQEKMARVAKVKVVVLKHKWHVFCFTLVLYWYL